MKVTCFECSHKRYKASSSNNIPNQNKREMSVHFSSKHSSDQAKQNIFHMWNGVIILSYWFYSLSKNPRLSSLLFDVIFYTMGFQVLGNGTKSYIFHFIIYFSYTNIRFNKHIKSQSITVDQFNPEINNPLSANASCHRGNVRSTWDMLYPRYISHILRWQLALHGELTD